MKYLTVFAAAAIVATGWADGAVAQSSPKVVPAEFPPSSFTGRQYVDSNGCVFIRAGIDNNITWVPRLTRGRQQVCGFQPSLSASTLASVNAPRATASTTTPTTAPAAAASPAPAPAPAPRVATVPASKPAAVPAAAPAKSKPAAAVTTARVSVPSSCTSRSTRAQQFLVSRRDDIRCGPQTQPHVTIKDGPPSPNATYYTFRGPQVTTGQVRVAPKHVYEDQLASTQGVFVPEGYEVVWEDDRLNTKRAHQTLAGNAQMKQMWTSRVPRTLKPNATAGSHVSYAAGGVPDSVPEVSRAATVTSVTTAAALAEDTRRASHRYVQVGAFSDAAHAKREAQRLANTGLPTKMGARTQGGQAYTLVIVGPFKTQGALDGGLAELRGLGYADATLKR